MPESTRGKLQWIVPGGTSIAPRILSPPELPNGFGHVIQPIRIGE